MNGYNEVRYSNNLYTCEDGRHAKIIILENATEDDIKGLYELLAVIAKRKFKVDLKGGGEK